MAEIGFGRLESVQIERGEVKFNPAPRTIRQLKFGAADQPAQSQLAPAQYSLKRPVADLIEFLRATQHGEIRRLEVRHGLPFSMEIEQPESTGDSHV
jgi:hypothetical protein